MGREPDDAVAVLRNPARWRDLFATLPLVLLVVVSLLNERSPTWLKLACVLWLLGLAVQRVLAGCGRIVVGPSGVDLRTEWGRRLRLAWTDIDHFAVRGRLRVDVHLTTGRRVAVMRFAPVEDESPASTVALLEHQRRRLSGTAPVDWVAGPTR